VLIAIGRTPDESGLLARKNDSLLQAHRCLHTILSKLLRKVGRASHAGSVPRLAQVRCARGRHALLYAFTRWRSTPRSCAAASRIIVSVVSQPTHPSVTEQPYLSCDRSDGIDCLPATIFDSIMTPISDLLPKRTWLTTSAITSG